MVFALAESPRNRTLTVVVAESPYPPSPATACLGAVSHTVNAAENGPPWRALCMKVGGELRIENLGPEGLTVDPANAVSCRYEAGVHQCRLLKAATVTFKITVTEMRPLTVVVIK